MIGYAAIDSKGKIFIRTVTDTVRGAKLNAIVLIGRFDIIRVQISDEYADELFELVAKIHDVTIKKVNVTLAGEND